MTVRRRDHGLVRRAISSSRSRCGSRCNSSRRARRPPSLVMSGIDLWHTTVAPAPGDVDRAAAHGAAGRQRDDRADPAVPRRRHERTASRAGRAPSRRRRARGPRAETGPKSSGERGTARAGPAPRAHRLVPVGRRDRPQQLVRRADAHLRPGSGRPGARLRGVHRVRPRGRPRRGRRAPMQQSDRRGHVDQPRVPRRPQRRHGEVGPRVRRGDPRARRQARRPARHLSGRHRATARRRRPC